MQPSTAIPIPNSNPRFYIPTSSSYASPLLPSSSGFSTTSLALKRRRSSQAYSTGSGGHSRSNSRVNLTAALQAYRVPPPAPPGLDQDTSSDPVLDLRADHQAEGSASGSGRRTRSATLTRSTSGRLDSQIHMTDDWLGAQMTNTEQDVPQPQTPPSAAAAYAQAYSMSQTDPDLAASSSSLALRPYPYPEACPTFEVPTRSNSGLRSAFDLAPRSSGGQGQMISGAGAGPAAVPPELMDALVEIHRVLYRGDEDKALQRQTEREWSGEVQEVRRVIERWFEGDCVYDHPLISIPSRPSLLSHFILLHLLSDVSIPALTPAVLFTRARELTADLRRRLLSGVLTEGDVETGDMVLANKGKGKRQHVDLAESWAEGEWHESRTSGVPTDRHRVGQPSQASRWNLWKVGAECREIGGVECYNGYHMGMIEHVVTITLLPALAHKQEHRALATRSLSASSISSLDLSGPDTLAQSKPRSFAGRLANALAREFEYLLHWDLPISTIVQFNEVGKATHIRDVIDIQDAIETFVPLAKRFGWLTRRVSGLVSSTLGSAVLGMLQIPKVRVQERITAGGGSTGQKHKEAFGLGLTFARGTPDRTREAISMDLDSGHSTAISHSASSTQMHLAPTHDRSARRANSLGLEGLDSLPPSRSGSLAGFDRHSVCAGGSASSAGMAPDRDEPGCDI